MGWWLDGNSSRASSSLVVGLSPSLWPSTDSHCFWVKGLLLILVGVFRAFWLLLAFPGFCCWGQRAGLSSIFFRDLQYCIAWFKQTNKGRSGARHSDTETGHSNWIGFSLLYHFSFSFMDRDVMEHEPDRISIFLFSGLQDQTRTVIWDWWMGGMVTWVSTRFLCIRYSPNISREDLRRSKEYQKLPTRTLVFIFIPFVNLD